MAAPKTVLTYPLNGAQRDFAIPFEYLARKFVVVTLIGKTRQVLTLNSDYRFTSRTTITTTKAWGPGDLFTSIEIRRVTSATERLVDFADGSILRAYDLNTSQVQSLHIAEEARDLTADTIGVNNDGDLDARGRNIVNVGDGVLDGDAVNMGQNRRWADSATNQANRSKTEADRSTLYAQESARHAGNSAASAKNSYDYAISSQQAQQASARSSTASAESAKNSYDYAISSQAARNASQGFRDTANEHRNASEASATRSQQSAVAAKQEADRAKTEADKLGNANQFMGTLRGISNGWVSWTDTWGLDAARIATNRITPRVAGDIQLSGNLVGSGMTIRATNVAADSSLTENGYRVWTSNTFDPASKMSIAGIGAGGSPAVKSKSMGTPSVYGGAIEIGPVLNSVLEIDAPGLTFHWPNKIAKKLFMDTGGTLRWGTPGGIAPPIAGLRRTGGDSRNGWKIDEDGWCEQWGMMEPPVTNAGRVKVTFPKPFTGALPQVFIQYHGQRGGAGEANSSIEPTLSLSSFELYSGQAEVTNARFMWRAYGRID